MVVVFFSSYSLFPHHFDETKLFQGEFIQLKEDFRLKFLNISRIMDCVGCDKCRLWGKVQVRIKATESDITYSMTMKVVFIKHCQALKYN